MRLVKMLRQSTHLNRLMQAVLLTAALTLLSPAASAEAQECASIPIVAGYRDHNYGSSPYSEITASKPQSKLWWHDGFWWGCLWSPAAAQYRIHRFDRDRQCWHDTGPAIDNRSKSLADALWDGHYLYIASHLVSSSGPARLYRYSYDSASRSYTLNSGFPVDITTENTEALTIAKDSSGQLWVAWTAGNQVKLNRSLGDDYTWGSSFVLPVQGNNLSSDDICALVAFGGNKIGVMWSNQNDRKTYFATHLDSKADTDWEPREEALADASLGAVADDHINLKVMPDEGGNVYAATKTSLTGSSSPLIFLLKRDVNANWSRYTFGTKGDNHTRPLLLIEEEHRELYIFAMSFKTSPRRIYMKKSSLDHIAFAGGLGTEFIHSASDSYVNNPTSTKQNLNSTTGLLVLASDKDTQNYLHNYIDLGGGVPGNQPPLANDDAATTPEDQAVAIEVLGNDSDADGSLNPASVTVATTPGHGTTAIDSATGTITYSPHADYFGPDSFTYTVKDNDGATSNRATVSVTVDSRNDAPLANADAATTSENTAVTIAVLANDSDVDGTLQAASVTIVQQPDFGTITAIDPAHGAITYTPANAYQGTDEFRYTVQDDQGAVSNAATVTVTVGGTGGGTVTFYASDDAHVKSSSPTKNYGAETTLRLRSSDPTYNTYFKFDLNGLTGAVQSARLRLYVVDGGPDGGALYAVSNLYKNSPTAWTESGLTWNNAPTISGAPLAQSGAVSGGTWVEYDVSAALSGSGVYSFAMTTSSTNSVYHSARQGEHPPELVVTTAGSAGGAPGNQAPVANDDAAVTPEDQAVTIAVIGNDSDRDGALDPGSVAIVVAPGHGTAEVLAGSGEIRYTPAENYFGEDHFTYTVRDDQGAVSNAAQVVVTITAVNDAPQAGDDSETTAMDTAVEIAVLSNDSDVDGGLNPASVAIVTSPGNGSIVTIDPATGAITYAPDAGFSGTDEFTYAVQDIEGATSNTATVAVTVGSAPPATLTFEPSDDALVKSASPTKNYGSDSTLRLRAGDPQYHSFLKFTVTGVSGMIQSARLRLYVTDGSTDGGSVYLVSNFYLNSSTPWQESGITWNNAPAIDGSPLATNASAAGNTWLEYEVSSAVTGNGTYSFGLKITSTNSLYLSAKEGANPPQLVITTAAALPLGAMAAAGGVEGLHLAHANGPPAEFYLAPVHPNPFHLATVIAYGLAQAAPVRLTIYNLFGQEVITLAEGVQPAGRQRVLWNGKNRHGNTVSSGIYLIRLTAGPHHFLRRVTLLK
ncbi:MAG: tandem-95 repeat protein [candidate division KSB1 bacterium]|nr:tandem-95 repeat protein [candidate division KSB1 bacterium]MDZ7276145.1 tandem-95 repeat protein [candidate division KSB1 bacterium]MDZ7287075.1 tandem-95 repeat protein [candidate division KSB1 bacterium]MDZ7297000.1 tandem-95 repeat protein [candidate division KSB1 bacterium]MDZ7306170.1 tandem-95 repeat protein [candidate division KSB1 bacterium]